jgi:hypothetical protein
VQMRITFSRGTDISFDGAATEELMNALFNIIVGNTPDPAMRKLLEAMEDEALKELDAATAPKAKVRAGASAATMGTSDILAEYKQLAKRWDESRASDDEGHGGSPGEWMVERMGELEHELKQRGASELLKKVVRP